MRPGAAARAARALPLTLTLMRAALAPVVIGLALLWPSRPAFGICLTIAFLSDVFDGILARRLGVATPALRRLDSSADTLFYLAVAWAAWYLHPAALTHRLGLLALLALLEVARYGLDLWRFGREASYHAWSAKLFGIALFAGCFSLMALGRDDSTLTAAIGCGIFADVEGLAISLVLKHWRTDVPTLLHALRFRTQT